MDELTTVPEDLLDLQPRPSQFWNFDEIGINLNGKWCKVIFTYKYCMTDKIWKCQDGEDAPYWVTVLFFTRADGQCFLPPIIVHQGAALSTDFLYGIPDDWIVHHSPSGYMDKDGWYKLINIFTKFSGLHAGNIQFFLRRSWLTLGFRRSRFNVQTIHPAFCPKGRRQQ